MDHTKMPLNSTIVEFLTKEVSYLNKNNDNLFKIIDTMRSSIDYTSNFIKSTCDLSGNFVSNMKIVALDSSNNIISYVCTDASGVFLPSMKLDLSMSDLSINSPLKQHYYELKNTMYSTEDHIQDGDTERHFRWGFHRHRPYPFYPYPYPHYPYYPRPYPYPYLNNDNDYNNRDVSLNHIPMPMPEYPNMAPPSKPPVIYRDLFNNMINMEGDDDFNDNIENYFLNPIHHSVVNSNYQKPNGNPLHRYTKK